MKVNIDNNLATKAQLLTKGKTKKATVEKALQLLIGLENPKRIIDLLGKTGKYL